MKGAWGMAYIGFMTMLPTLSILSSWYRSKDIDYQEGGMAPDKWVSWGTCRAFNPKYDCRYFSLWLPSFEWQSHPWCNRYGWAQLHLWKFADKTVIGYHFRTLP